MDARIRAAFPDAKYLLFQTNTGVFIANKGGTSNPEVSGLTSGSVGHCFVHKNKGPVVGAPANNPETLPQDLLSELREFLPGLGLPNCAFTIEYEWEHGSTMPEFNKESYFRKIIELVKSYKLEDFMELAGLKLQPQLSKVIVRNLVKQLKKAYKFQPLVQVVKKRFFQLIIGLNDKFEPVSANIGWIGARARDVIEY